MSEKAKPIRTLTLSLNDLHPTQMSVGMVEVKEKVNQLKRMINTGDSHKLQALLKSKPIPGVIGPGNVFYIIDHHHLARALHESGIDTSHCNVLEDYSSLSKDKFWNVMSDKKWVYPYDENGKGPWPYADIPDHVESLKDDPYRSLAGAVEKKGGYNKTTTPFAEFLWADYLRTVVPNEQFIKSDFKVIVHEAFMYVHDASASSLPGYIPASTLSSTQSST